MKQIWQEIKDRWPLVADMEEQAESAEARQMLHSIAVAGYHREEASAGMI